MRINDDPSTANWQWLAAHSVAPNGRIDVIWYDTRGSGNVNVAQLYYAYSWDAGVTWSANVPVTPPFNTSVGYPQQSKIGDYSTIRSDESGRRCGVCRDIQRRAGRVLHPCLSRLQRERDLRT